MAARAREPRWVSRLVVDAVHADLLLTHGGLPGLRDAGLLESALARPRQRFVYDATSDLAALAAAYGFGLARNHPYRDGNKRVAFVTMAVFLGLNGLDCAAAETEVVTTMVALASGTLDEDALAGWIRLHTEKRLGKSRWARCEATSPCSVGPRHPRGEASGCWRRGTSPRRSCSAGSWTD